MDQYILSPINIRPILHIPAWQNLIASIIMCNSCQHDRVASILSESSLKPINCWTYFGVSILYLEFNVRPSSVMFVRMCIEWAAPWWGHKGDSHPPVF